jgi:predicted transcriptional regulator YheO
MPKKYIEQFIPLVDAIAGTFGKNCEVVLHNLRKPQQSIIKIANGHVTGRDVGAPITDFGLFQLEKHNLRNLTNDSIIGYRSKTKKGAELRSTTIFIKNSKDKIVGALCINIDISAYVSAKNVLEELCTTPITINEDGEKESPETFESNVDTLISDLLKQATKKVGKSIVHMGREDKLRIIRDLKEKGFFLIKGTAKRVSKELNVSLATIYKYLEEIQEI